MNIGKRIFKLRKQNHMTQQEIADRCDFTVSLLSKIENGATIPPVATLSRIAKVLGTTVSVLLDENENRKTIINRGKDLNSKNMIRTDKGYLFYSFAIESHDKKMQPYLFVTEKGKVNPGTLSHEGEEFIYILEGETKYRVGEVEYRLGPGDSLYFDALEEHEVIPISKQVRYLAVFTD